VLDRKGILLFQLILTVGQLLFAMGAKSHSYEGMLFGRFIFGLGGDSMFVGMSAIVAQWFRGGEVSFAFGLILSIGRLGSVINGFVVPAAAENHDVFYALMIGFFVCIASTIGAICLIILDWWADKKDQQAEAIVLDEDRLRLGDMLKLKLPFWLIIANTFFVNSAVITYIVISSSLLQEKYGFSEMQAGQIYSIPYMIAACISPCAGLYIDKHGKRARFSKYR
jgi:nitrate/nitrite transporter NarK